MAQHDLYLVEGERSFVANLFKGATGIWFRICLVTGLAVAFSTYFSGIISFVLAESEPMVFAPFARTMETLIAMRGPDLFRVKGFLEVIGCRGPVVVQFVQHLAHPPVELAAWPDGERGSKVVFITRNLPEAAVRTLLAATRAVAAES